MPFLMKLLNTLETQFNITGLPSLSLYAPIDRLTFFYAGSALNAAATPKIGSAGPNGTLDQTEVE